MMHPEPTTAHLILRVVITGNANVTDLAAAMIGSRLCMGHGPDCDHAGQPEAMAEITDAVPVADVTSLGPLAGATGYLRSFLDAGGMAYLEDQAGPGGRETAGPGAATGPGTPGDIGG